MVMIGTKEVSESQLATLAELGLLQIGEKHDTSSTTPTAQAYNGPYPGNSAMYGPFSGAGVRPGMFNTTARVNSFGAQIPLLKSENQNELLEIMTGVTAGSGNNVTSACTVGPKAGDLKVMRVQYTFGIVHMSTRIDDITQVGMKRNRADIEREVYNGAAMMNPWLPQVPGIDGVGKFPTRLRGSLYTLGVELERNLAPVQFVGVADTEDNTYRGIARQWNGLDQLIKTGYTDSGSGYAAAAVDSNVQSFAANLSTTDAQGRSIVEALTDLWFAQQEKAERLKLADVQWALIMRPDMFRAVTERWACTYATYRCANTQAGMPINQSAMDVYEIRTDMFNNKYLIIEGVRVPVITDDSIARQTLGNGYYQSDIYMPALSWAGVPLLYGQYFDMANAEAEEFTQMAGLSNSETTTVNDGLYRVFKRVTGGCYEFDFFARPRLILDAPFLSARLDDVRYNSYYKATDPIPGFSGYTNGGVSYRT